MKPQPDSPNWHWQQLGYQVERAGQHRTIRRPDGSTVEIDQREGEYRHDAEVRAALGERLLPHGPAECQAAQLDIFNDSKGPAHEPVDNCRRRSGKSAQPEGATALLDTR